MEAVGGLVVRCNPDADEDGLPVREHGVGDDVRTVHARVRERAPRHGVQLAATASDVRRGHVEDVEGEVPRTEDEEPVVADGKVGGAERAPAPAAADGKVRDECVPPGPGRGAKVRDRAWTSKHLAPPPPSLRSMTMMLEFTAAKWGHMIVSPDGPSVRRPLLFFRPEFTSTGPFPFALPWCCLS